MERCLSRGVLLEELAHEVMEAKKCRHQRLQTAGQALVPFSSRSEAGDQERQQWRTEKDGQPSQDELERTHRSLAFLLPFGLRMDWVTPTYPGEGISLYLLY